MSRRGRQYTPAPCPEVGLRVGVVFGGRSVEHDVSIITGLQACEELDARHQPVPLYIDREGRWFTGDGAARYRRPTGRRRWPPNRWCWTSAAAGCVHRRPSQRRGMFGRGARAGAPAEQRLDVVIPATHGTQGEDGCLQGALELADVPYAGPTLESAVLAMNKAVTKSMLRAAQIPVLEDLTLRRSEYEREGPEAIIAKIKARFGLPVYAKPASLGSSVGVSRCADEAAAGRRAAAGLRARPGGAGGAGHRGRHGDQLRGARPSGRRAARVGVRAADRLRQSSCPSRTSTCARAESGDAGRSRPRG